MAKRKHSDSCELEISQEAKRPRTDIDVDTDALTAPSTCAVTYQMPNLRLRPWTSSEISVEYPPLPYITDGVLRKAVFTHRGTKSQASSMDNERLEWEGDAHIELIATLLIKETFTELSAGRLSQIRETLVKNETLATYARHYGFNQILNVPSEIFEDVSFATSQKARLVRERNQTKVMGDVFEAYVAGIINSDPQEGMATACTWLKALWSITIKDKIKEEDARKSKQRKLAASTLRAPNSMPPIDQLAKLIGYRGVDITYEDGPSEKNSSGFTVYVKECYYQSPTIPRLILGSGKDIKKAKAKSNAAQNALENTTLIEELAVIKDKETQKFNCA